MSDPTQKVLQEIVKSFSVAHQLSLGGCVLKGKSREALWGFYLTQKMMVYRYFGELECIQSINAAGVAHFTTVKLLHSIIERWNGIG
jgi:hypothetical protein